MIHQKKTSGPTARRREIDQQLYLDATLSAFLRFGVGRTRMTDIAAEAHVSRTTAYRMLGSVDRAATSLLQREIDRLLSEAIRGLDSATDASDVLAVCALAMERVERHPLLRKIREDEPGIIGKALVLHTAPIIDTVTSTLAPTFGRLVEDGVLVVDEHENVIDRLVRLGITCVLSPPRAGYQSLLGDVLRG